MWYEKNFLMSILGLIILNEDNILVDADEQESINPYEVTSGTKIISRYKPYFMTIYTKKSPLY